MKRLAEAVALIAAELHADRIEAICSALASAPGSEVSKVLSSSLGSSLPHHLKQRLQHALQTSPSTTAGELVAMFRGAGAMSKFLGTTSIEMVWTGPSTEIVATRHTEQVLTGLIDAAQARIFMVSFVAYHVAGVIDALRKAIARGVRISLLVERSKEHGGNVSVDSVALLKKEVPEVAIFEWNRDAALAASVHAKCAVADGATAFITSANLSDAAMTRNMELGVLIRGGNLPVLLEQHLNALIQTRQLRSI